MIVGYIHATISFSGKLGTSSIQKGCAKIRLNWNSNTNTTTVYTKVTTMFQCGVAHVCMLSCKQHVNNVCMAVKQDDNIYTYFQVFKGRKKNMKMTNYLPPILIFNDWKELTHTHSDDKYIPCAFLTYNLSSLTQKSDWETTWWKSMVKN